MIFPTFFIVGAPKAGTTYLAAVMEQHPDVFISVPKEPSYYSSHAIYGTRQYGLTFYQKCFAQYAGQKEIGDASTVYLFDERSPGMIAADSPTAKILVLVRDPLERLVSHYLQLRKSGRVSCDLEDFVFAASPDRDEALHVNRYAEHIQRFSAVFGRSNVLILFNEDMRARPLETVNLAIRFLDLDPMQRLNEVSKDQENQGAVARSQALQRYMLRNRAVTMMGKRLLPASAIPASRRVWRLLWRFNTRPHSRPALTAEAKKYLYPFHRETISDLEALTGRSLRIWHDSFGPDARVPEPC